MEKLTKEQAQWMLEKIKPKLCNSAQAKQNDREIIQINLAAATKDFQFGLNQFKQFTDGCIRVCKWLEEQE